jgi:hypothetical protein
MDEGNVPRTRDISFSAMEHSVGFRSVGAVEDSVWREGVINTALLSSARYSETDLDVLSQPSLKTVHIPISCLHRIVHKRHLERLSKWKRKAGESTAQQVFPSTLFI